MARDYHARRIKVGHRRWCGGRTIRIQVEDLKTDEPMAFGLTELLSGRKTVKDGKMVGHSFSIEGGSATRATQRP
jgi:hypothetical protein